MTRLTPAPTWWRGAALRVAVVRAVAVLALSVAGGALANTYSYDVDLYNRYVSNGAWWTHSSMTNASGSWATWRVSFSTRFCTDLSGAVSLAISARIASRRSSCSTGSRDMSTVIPPRRSASLRQRAVLHYDYYRIRKIDRYTGRVLDSGFATRRDSFTDYGFTTY